MVVQEGSGSLSVFGVFLWMWVVGTLVVWGMQWAIIVWRVARSRRALGVVVVDLVLLLE